VIQYIDSEIDHEANTIHVVMEFGEIDLWHMLRQLKESGEGLNENYIRLYWQQMLEAVQTIHEERIIHSDLKPANFLCVSGMLKLIDFGIARIIQSDSTSIMCEKQMGTLNYMSPEAINSNSGGGGKIGRASDVWSLGCILYEMGYGAGPFASIKALVQKIQCITNPGYEIQYPEIANTDLEATCRSCLQRDPKLRPTIPELLAHPFLDPTARIKEKSTAPTTSVPAPSVSALQVQALLPVLQQLAALNVPIDGSVGHQISEEIARQLADTGNVDITGIVNNFKQMKQESELQSAPLSPTPSVPKPTARPKRTARKAPVEDKENCPPNQQAVAAPGGISKADLVSGAQKLKSMKKVETSSVEAQPDVICAADLIMGGTKLKPMKKVETVIRKTPLGGAALMNQQIKEGVMARTSEAGDEDDTW